MGRPPFVVLAFPAIALSLAALHASASVCTNSAGANQRALTTEQHWKLDHYVYDATLKQYWEVLIDCDHPQTPAQTLPIPISGGRSQTTKRHAPFVIEPGSEVEVSTAANASSNIYFSGTVMEGAFAGQSIPVRLSASGKIVRAFVRGPHSVELAATDKPLWRER